MALPIPIVVDNFAGKSSYLSSSYFKSSVLSSSLSYRFLTCRLLSCRLLSYRLLYYRLLTCRLLSHRFPSCRLISCRLLTCRFLTFQLLIFRLLSYHLLPYRFFLSFSFIVVFFLVISIFCSSLWYRHYFWREFFFIKIYWFHACHSYLLSLEAYGKTLIHQKWISSLSLRPTQDSITAFAWRVVGLWFYLKLWSAARVRMFLTAFRRTFSWLTILNAHPPIPVHYNCIMPLPLQTTTPSRRSLRRKSWDERRRPSRLSLTWPPSWSQRMGSSKH